MYTLGFKEGFASNKAVQLDQSLMLRIALKQEYLMFHFLEFWKGPRVCTVQIMFMVEECKFL